MANPMQPLTAKKLLTLLEQSNDPELMVFEILLRTGCRTHELRDMQFYDDHAYIFACKGSQDHHVPLSPEFLTRLKPHIQAIRNRMSEVSHQSYKSWLRRRWAAFKSDHEFLRPYSLHSLRSAFAILVQTASHDVLLTQQLLGHSSIKSTMHYVRTAVIESNRNTVLAAIKA